MIGLKNVGITTFFKQMKIIYGEGFSNEERLSYKREITNNILFDMQILLRAKEEEDPQDPNIEKVKKVNFIFISTSSNQR